MRFPSRLRQQGARYDARRKGVAMSPIGLKGTVCACGRCASDIESKGTTSLAA